MPYQSNHPTLEEKERYKNSMKFMNAIKRIPHHEVRLGKLKKTRDGFEQKRVDVLLSVDLVRMSWGKQIDTAIFIAGDSDFVPAVQAAKDAGVVVILYYAVCLGRDGHITTSAHDEPKYACDECIVIDQNMIGAIRPNQ